MSNVVTKSRGRPKVVDQGAKVTIYVDARKLDMADAIAADLDACIEGLRHSRGDVLRAALSRGLDAMRADVAARMNISKG